MHEGAAVRPSGIEPLPLSPKNDFDRLRLVFALTVLLVHRPARSRATDLHRLGCFNTARKQQLRKPAR
jgi:hypothetical protein